MRKPVFCICKNKVADQLRGNHTMIVQSLYFLNAKFQASNHLLWLSTAQFVRTWLETRKRCSSYVSDFIEQDQLS